MAATVAAGLFFFYLKDGSYIRSFADNHQRIDSSYKISGMLYREGESHGKFEGVLPDTSIKTITRDKFNWTATMLAVPLRALALAGALIFASKGSFLH
jgi:hypothetical protein